MFSVTVRDHVMIAHSFKGEVFGQRAAAAWRHLRRGRRVQRRRLDADGIVIDIGRATEVLRQVLAELNYRNSMMWRNLPDGIPPPSFWQGSSSGLVAAGTRGELGPVAAVEQIRVSRSRVDVAPVLRGPGGRERLMPDPRRSSCPNLLSPGPAATSTIAASSMDCERRAGPSMCTRSTTASRGRRRKRSPTRPRYWRLSPVGRSR